MCVGKELTAPAHVAEPSWNELRDFGVGIESYNLSVLTCPTASSSFAGKSGNAPGIGINTAGSGLGLCPGAEDERCVMPLLGAGSGQSTGEEMAGEFLGE